MFDTMWAGHAEVTAQRVNRQTSSQLPCSFICRLCVLSWMVPLRAARRLRCVMYKRTVADWKRMVDREIMYRRQHKQSRQRSKNSNFMHSTALQSPEEASAPVNYINCRVFVVRRRTASTSVTDFPAISSTPIFRSCQPT